MRRLFGIVLVCVFAWKLYELYRPAAIPAPTPRPSAAGVVPKTSDDDWRHSTQPAGDAAAFHCDGRRYCSQMTSCAEAQFFLSHCPDTKMDGDADGRPCEEQWCGH
jgi:hypothetical protein